MTGKVIQFSSFTKQKDPEPNWICDISLFETGQDFSCRINSVPDDMPMPDGEYMRKIADCLDVISFVARQEAEDLDESVDGHAMALLHVFKSGTVRVRIDDKLIVDDAGFSWLTECVELANDKIKAGEV